MRTTQRTASRVPTVPRLLRAALLGLSLGAMITQTNTPAVAADPKPAAASLPQPAFATPEDAVAALVKAIQADDVAALDAILGPGSQRLVSSGDPVADKNGRAAFVSAYDTRHALEAKDPDTKLLTVGDNGWPLPFPLARVGGQWHFDATAGAEEVINRRIGGNELFAIRTLLSGVQAEQDYFDRTKRGTGTGIFAGKVFSTPGTYDGLYWDAEDGDPPSPLDPLVRSARDEGYLVGRTSDGKPAPYHGYLYRMLRAQGPSASGGAKDYVRNGQMTEGFAIMASPADYGNSGIMSFIVGQDGTVYQKDLGPRTAAIAGGITRFDPDPTWARIDVTDE